MPDDINTLRRILKENTVITVVGLPADWFSAELFRREVHDGAWLHGDSRYRSRREIPHRVGMVDVFRV